MYRSKKLSKPQWDKHRKNKQTKETDQGTL